MTQDTFQTITEVGTDGNKYWAVIGNEEMPITRTQYFRILLLDEDDKNVTMEDVADNFFQIASGNLAF